MDDEKILLDPVLFDALHLSALAHGGVGAVMWYDDDDCPLCIEGHAAWLDGATFSSIKLDPSPTVDAIHERGLNAHRNDCILRFTEEDRIPFSDWCEIVGVDVR